MFVKTIRFNKKTAVWGVIAAAVLLIAIVVITANGENAGDHSIFDFSSVATNEGRIEFLRECGWEVEEEPIEVKTILIPKEFSNILTEYNELQLSSGFNLLDFAGLTVEQYTYRVTNYKNVDCEVNATLYIYNSQVVGGDIHSTSIDGFMHGLK